MGFCTPDEVTRFFETAPAFEKAMVDSGIPRGRRGTSPTPTTSGEAG
jgi:hypothetical protein